MLMTTIPGKAIVAVIDDESYKRMEAGDPFTFPFKSLGITSVEGLELVIGRASDEAISNAKHPLEILRHIFRGYSFKPEDGYKPFKVEFTKENIQ